MYLLGVHYAITTIYNEWFCDYFALRETCFFFASTDCDCIDVGDEKLKKLAQLFLVRSVLTFEQSQ